MTHGAAEDGEVRLRPAEGVEAGEAPEVLQGERPDDVARRAPGGHGPGHHGGERRDQQEGDPDERQRHQRDAACRELPAGAELPVPDEESIHRAPRGAGWAAPARPPGPASGGAAAGDAPQVQVEGLHEDVELVAAVDDLGHHGADAVGVGPVAPHEDPLGPDGEHPAVPRGVGRGA